MVNSRIEKPLLDKEMTVVRNEFEMGENDPDNISSERALESAYIWHNYGKLPHRQPLRYRKCAHRKSGGFLQKYYQPDNALLTDRRQVRRSQSPRPGRRRLFGAIPKPTRTLEPPYTVEPTQDGERSVTLRRVGDTQGIMALYHTPAGHHPDDAAAQVLAGVLGDTPSGRLYKALVDNKKAVAASMDMEDLHDPGFLTAP